MSELIDNSRHRIQALKTIIRQLHDGATPESLKTRFKSVLDEVGPSEIGAMENELMAEGMPQEKIQRMCDVHAAMLAEADDRPPAWVEGAEPAARLDAEAALAAGDTPVARAATH